MRWIAKFAGLIHFLFCVFTLLAYALCYWPVFSHWLSGFITMSLPVVMGLHIFCCIGGILAGARKVALNSFLLLMLSFPLWSRTYRFSQEEVHSQQESFKLLSYNVHNLGVRVKTDGEKPLLSQEGIKWLKEVDADVLCFQEAFQEGNKNHDLVRVLRDMGYRYYAMANHEINEKPKHQAGLAIFSKHRLQNMEEEEFEFQNGLLKVDVMVGDAKMTIVNVHLQSMTLNLRELVEQRQIDGIKSESRKTVSLLKKGFQKRKNQISILETWILEAESPVIVCGDFNETPYSYAYGRLSKVLANSFEEGGEGFGFTYRNLPYFIRIDNQFFDPDKIALQHFETVRSVNFSDHRPTIGSYTLK